MHSTGEFEITELASWGSNRDQRVQTIPWKFIGCTPDPQNEQEVNDFNSSPYNKFGAWKFEEACILSQPDYVIALRDAWHDQFTISSPFRKFYNLIWSPAVDSSPQKEEWLSWYKECDAVLTYTEWAKNVLDEASGSLINTVGAISPVCGSMYVPVNNKKEHKQLLGFPPDAKIIGTVMRNQKRKDFPRLFEAFEQYVLKHNLNDTYLYCHTSYPDNGWDMPHLLKNSKVAHKIVFTYTCPNCGNVFPSLFRDGRTSCPKCMSMNACMPNTNIAVSDDVMAAIYNCFDVYVQYSACFPAKTKVYVNSSWKNIEDVKVGDKAYTHNNRQQNVTNTFIKEYTGKLIKIKNHSNYHEIKCTPEHPFLALKNTKYSTKSRVMRVNFGDKLRRGMDLPSPEFYRAEELEVGDLLVYPIDEKILDINIIDIKDYVTKEELESKKYVFDNDTFHTKSGKDSQRFIEVDNDFCRFIGLFSADGSSANRVSLQVTSHEDDKNNIKLSIDTFDKIIGRHGCNKYKERKAVTVVGGNVLLAKIFDSWFSSWFDKKLPDWVDSLPLEKQKEVLIGMFMGDGCKIKDKNVSTYSTTSKRLNEQLQNILRRLNIPFNTSIRYRTDKAPAYITEVRGDIKRGEIDCSRQSSRNFYYKGRHYLQIKKIDTEEFSGKVYNFEVDIDNSYLTEIGVVHNCEGLAMPQVEAGACGIPVMSTDYSAMSEVVRKLGGEPIAVKTFNVEMESNRNWAISDNDHLVSLLEKFFQQTPREIEMKSLMVRQAFEEHYSSWEKVGKKWYDVIKSLPQNKLQWNNDAMIHIPSTNFPPQHCSNKEYVKWLIVDVLGEPERLGTFMEARLIRDLNFGSTNYHVGGLYHNDETYTGDEVKPTEFNRNHAYQHMAQLCERRNHWERIRVSNVK